jgi:hypothetical protein
MTVEKSPFRSKGSERNCLFATTILVAMDLSEGKMQIVMLGHLKPHPRVPEFLESEPLPIPFFDGQRLPVSLLNLQQADATDVEDALSSFLKLGQQDRLAVGQYVFANYQVTAKLAAEQGFDLDCVIASDKDVWEHVQPGGISISRRNRRDRAMYVVIGANCDWEVEHGLQIVYRRGSELVRVSDQDGHLTHTDAYDLPEEQDRIVS